MKSKLAAFLVALGGGVGAIAYIATGPSQATVATILADGGVSVVEGAPIPSVGTSLDWCLATDELLVPGQSCPP